jgi:guanylate kinase
VLERFGNKNKIENMNAVFSEYLLDIDFENIKAVKKMIKVLLIIYKYILSLKMKPIEERYKDPIGLV